MNKVRTHNPFLDIDGKKYLQHRPQYPEALINSLDLSLKKKKKPLVLDLATGNGQVAIQLANKGYTVIGIDSSNEQLKNAQEHFLIDYRFGFAESTGLNSESIDLISIGSSLHWFDHEKFFEEAYRILKPEGTISAFCYDIGRYASSDNDYLNSYFINNFDLRYNNGMPEPLRKYVYTNQYKNINYPTDKFSELEYTLYPESKIMTVREYIELIKTTAGCKGYNTHMKTDLGEKMYTDLSNFLDFPITYTQTIFNLVLKKK